VTARGLENDRLVTREALFDIRLRLGEHCELVSELERAVAADPLRERSHAQLMLAARQLVAESGTKGMRVVVYGHLWTEGLTAFMVSTLRQLGYRASEVIPPSDAALSALVNQSRNNIQATNGLWGDNYPSASEWFDFWFRCSAWRPDDPTETRNGAFYCDPAADRLMDQADAEMVTDPAAADQTWAKVDRLVTDDAPWVTLANMNEVDFMSARVSNYQYDPVFGVLLDQLSVGGSGRRR
jgi:peptide/nickel transport system substrate-binding protein